jgi:hypothetical protein
MEMRNMKSEGRGGSGNTRIRREELVPSLDL